MERMSPRCFSDPPSRSYSSLRTITYSGGASMTIIALTPLSLTVSNPPTQAEVQALADKLDELINTLNA